MKPRLRIPITLTVVAVASVSSVLAQSCGHGESPPTSDASCQVFCQPDGSGGGSNCPFPTCATGSNLDECPPGCVPEPIV